jgi:hypothetical protein
MNSNFKLFFYVLMSILLCNCKGQTPQKVNSETKAAQHDSMTKIDLSKLNIHIDTPFCDDNGCTGTYSGVEFIDSKYIKPLGLTGTDIAHNYSNLMAKFVGNKLKELYSRGIYVAVDFKKITMSTKGMGDDDGLVEYKLLIPFKKVKNKAQAMTGFDHSGGWGHRPAIEKRVERLKSANPAIVKNKELFVSPLYVTPEGLQEYWIQWQHANY